MISSLPICDAFFFNLACTSTLVAVVVDKWRGIASTDLYLIPVLALMRRCSAQALACELPAFSAPEMGKDMHGFFCCYRVDH